MWRKFLESFLERFQNEALVQGYISWFTSKGWRRGGRLQAKLKVHVYMKWIICIFWQAHPPPKNGIRHDFIHLFPIVCRQPKTIVKMFRIWEFLLCYNVYVSTFLFYLWLKFSVFVSSMFSYFSRSMNAGENHNNGIFSIPIHRFLSLMILFYYTGICADISMV